MNLGPMRVADAGGKDQGVGFLRGGGEMGARMREQDWSRTPLGDPARWPSSLKTAVRIMLTSRQPKFVWWGAELTNLYNDPYAAILGARHPQAFARPAAQIWTEIWDQLGPRARQVLTNDEGTFDESLHLLIERNGYPEDAYFTFSYSPIPGEDGRPGGIICACIEDTRRIAGERQLTLLQMLATRTSDARNAAEACHLAAECIGTHPHLMPFALLYLLDSVQGQASLAGCAGIEPGSPAAPRSLAMSAGPWRLSRVLSRRKSWQIADLRRGRVDVASDDPRRRPRYAVQVPIMMPGHHEPVAVLIAGLNPYRVFDGPHRDFIELVAGQVAAGIFNAQAYEAETRKAEALAQINRAKTVFFSNISHEFRTPLTLMLGPLEALAQLPEQQLPEGLRDDVAIARRNGLRLLKLVNMLLDFARLEAGRTRARYEPVDLAAETREIASEFFAVAEKAGLSLRISCEPLGELFYVDRDMWEKIVLNLLSNAIKFTLAGEVSLKLEVADGRLRLEVSDTGIGIPAEELPRIFDRFHRVEDRRGRSFEGSGIGLALVRELVGVHGGTMDVSSVEGQGSRFTVTLPRGKEHLPPALVATTAEAGPRGGRSRSAFMLEAAQWLPEGSLPAQQPVTDGHDARAARTTILFADDNADMRAYIARLLSGHRVIAVEDGEQALAVARQQPVDLVLTDAMMPRLDGAGLLAALRSDPATATLPVIILSAHAGEEARIEGLRGGADDYLTKPFSARELNARVEAQLATARLRKLSSQREHALRTDAEILVDLAQKIGAELDLKRLVQKVTDAGVRLTGAAVGAFFYNSRGESGESQLLHVLSGAPEDAFANFGLPRRAPLFARTLAGSGVVRSGDITLSAGVYGDASANRLPLESPSVRSYLAVPVKGRSGEVIGALLFGHPEADVFDERAERLAVGIAAQAAVAIDNARAYEDATRAIERSIRSERAYRNSDRRYRQLINAMPVAVYTCDAEGVLTLSNHAAARLWGREPKIGKDSWCGSYEIFSAVDGGRIAPEDCPMAVALREERPIYGAEIVIGRPDGTRRHALVYPRPLYDENGVVTGAINILVDITEQKQKEQALRRSEQLYRAIGESIDYGVWICDAQGRNVYASDSLLRLIGMTQQECSEMGWAQALHPEDRDDTLAAWRACVAAGGNWDREHRFRGRDGRWHPVLARGVAVRDERGVVSGWAGINLDIERLKRVEDQLRESDQRKNEFLAILAHELRNPLAPIRNGIEVLKRAQRDSAAAAQAQALMERQVGNMVRLVDDLLDLSRITRGLVELRREPLDVRGALRNAIEACRTLFEEAGHELRVEIPEQVADVVADATRMEQIFVNLLGNAARYTPRGGLIEVALCIDQKQVTIRVTDNGIGIPASMRGRIFEMFAQGDRTLERSTGGLGIGLTLVQRLVSMHGGTVEVHSEGEGMGSEFIVRLPRAADQMRAIMGEVLAAPRESPGEPWRILIVDDHPDAAASMALMLGLRGDDVRVARNGVEAVAETQQFRPHLILMDIGMPLLNGYDACRRIRALDEGRVAIIVAMTGWGQAEDMRRSSEAGFDHHWVKPVAMQQIDRLLDDLAQRQGPARSSPGRCTG